MGFTVKVAPRVLVLIVVAMAVALPKRSQLLAAEPFFRGKEIRIVVGGGPGMAFDLVGRTVAKHLPKYVSGSPRVFVENRAEGEIAMSNYLARSARRDGTILGGVGRAYSLPQVRGDPGVSYDARDLIAVGSVASSLYGAIVIRTDLPYETLEDLRKAKETIYLGSTEAGGTAYEFVKAVEALLGLPNIKAVTGYRGFGAVLAATARGELHGHPLGLDSANARRLISPWPAGRQGKMKVLLYAGPRSAELDAAKVPHVVDLNLPRTAKEVFQVLSSTMAAAYPYVLPPGVPEGRVDLLRKAFTEMSKYPEFTEEMRKLGFKPDFLDGESVARIHEIILKSPPEVVKLLKSLGGG